MAYIVSEISKYLMMIMILCYTYECFHVFQYEHKPKTQKRIYNLQRFFLSLIHLNGFLILFIYTYDYKIIAFYLMQLVLFTGIYFIYRFYFKKASELLLNNMIMLLVVSFIMLTRISYAQAFKQFWILLFATIVSFLVIYLLSKDSHFRDFGYVYAGIGIILLAIVLVLGAVSYGAKLNITLFGFSIQPSEFVKLSYVFFIAAMLYKNTSLKQVFITSIFAGIHVLILVASKDLGAALIFFVIYLSMIYVATKKLAYYLGGLGFVVLAGILGYLLFPHVRTRFIAWIAPLSDIDNKGYQICQSLFGIGTGGWFGMGLKQGMPSKIPVVQQDFIFAAIAEEMGIIFAFCLMLICLSCFFMILNISMTMKDHFYRLVALGLGVSYIFQVFLSIGGVTKFIPSTGVTIPFVSYGGSSLLSSMILFGIIQGFYIMKGSLQEKKEKAC